MPPQKVIDVATTPPPKGTFCPDGCGKGGEYYKDKDRSTPNPTYAKGADGNWVVTYTGNDAKNQIYHDRVTVDISKDPPVVEPKDSSVQIDNVWKETYPGTSNPKP